jgi:hypothetical protein
MAQWQLFAQPWWVNLLILIPVIAFWAWRKQGLEIRRRQLLFIAIFAIAFGFVEAAVVVYLRAAVGLLPGYQGTLTDVQHSAAEFYKQAEALRTFPQSLLEVELVREAATMVMLVAIALLSSTRARERWAAFLWAFACWDIAYYGFLWLTVRWPRSIRDLDVLFLIPVPWLSQVWFPLLVSGFTLLAVANATTRHKSIETK